MIANGTYVHGGDVYRSRVTLDFSANVNPLGTPEPVKAAIRAAAESVDRYPDPYCTALRKALSERLGVSPEAIVCGKDCRFGYMGAGNVQTLQKLGSELFFDTVVVEDVFWKGEKISSSLIRRELSDGRIENANEMLMRPYLFYGEVVHGRKLGRTLGMPTVNLIPEAEKLLPPKGVYYSRVLHMGQEYRSITNLGCKPTIEGEKPSFGVESYLYHFDEEIYGDFLYVSLYHYVREEMRFETVDALKVQMQQDIAAGEAWHRDHI